MGNATNVTLSFFSNRKRSCQSLIQCHYMYAETNTKIFNMLGGPVSFLVGAFEPRSFAYLLIL